MKSTYREIAEIEEMHEDVINLQNTILDNYKKDPKLCNHLLKQLSKINSELDELEKDFNNILKEL